MTPPTETELEDDRWLAAEHALGVLDGARRDEAVRRAAADPAFRAEVQGWTDRLAPLLTTAADTQPSPAVWAAIRSRLDADAVVAPVAADSRRPQRRGLWHDVRVWRGATAGALALAAASWLVTLTPRSETPPPAPVGRTPVLAAALTAEAGPALFTVMVDRDRGQVAVAPLRAWTPDRARELWIIPADGHPHSLGLIAPGGPTSMPLPPDLAGVTGPTVTFAVSDEPIGGSPGEGPSGPVLATGTLTAL